MGGKFPSTEEKSGLKSAASDDEWRHEKKIGDLKFEMLNRKSGKPFFKGGVVVKVVLPAVETEWAATGDVLREIVDVDGVFRDELVTVDCQLVDFWMRFDETCFERKNSLVEKGKLGEFIVNPWRVDAADVGEQDQLVTVCRELADALPHGFVRSEDVSPCVVEFLVRSATSKNIQRPLGVGIDGDFPGFEFILAL